MPVTNKLGRVGIYSEGLLSINSRNPLIKSFARSRKILDLSYLYYN